MPQLCKYTTLGVQKIASMVDSSIKVSHFSKVPVTCPLVCEYYSAWLYVFYNDCFKCFYLQRVTNDLFSGCCRRNQQSRTIVQHTPLHLFFETSSFRPLPWHDSDHRVFLFLFFIYFCNQISRQYPYRCIGMALLTSFAHIELVTGISKITSKIMFILWCTERLLPSKKCSSWWRFFSINFRISIPLHFRINIASCWQIVHKIFLR